ncbi:MAG: hypothetical protein JWO24_2688 [Rhodospirillales bacterium]|jgi:hypothetical protein|nr:hypothetical protein [Rhodospirillales bacterium]
MRMLLGAGLLAPSAGPATDRIELESRNGNRLRIAPGPTFSLLSDAQNIAQRSSLEAGRPRSCR